MTEIDGRTILFAVLIVIVCIAIATQFLTELTMYIIRKRGAKNASKVHGKRTGNKKRD